MNVPIPAVRDPNSNSKPFPSTVGRTPDQAMARTDLRFLNRGLQMFDFSLCMPSLPPDQTFRLTLSVASRAANPDWSRKPPCKFEGTTQPLQ